MDDVANRSMIITSWKLSDYLEIWLENEVLEWQSIANTDSIIHIV